MTTEFRKRVPDLPLAGPVTGADEFPVWQTSLGLARAPGSALATYLVPLVAGAQPWVDLPTAATANLAGTSSPNVRFTGTTTVNSLGTGTDGTRRNCRAASNFTLTHGANLNCPGSVNIDVRAGDRFVAVLVGTSQWLIEDYQRADGTALSTANAPAGMRNRVVNGDFRVDQEFEFASTTITAAAALKWVADVFYAWCTGANVTAQNVTVSGNQRLRITGAASNTLVGVATRLERRNTSDLAGQPATLQVKLSSSSLTSVNWAVYYANTNDTFGSIASPTRTLIALGSFTGITSTEAQFSTTFSVPGAATTGLEIVITTGALLASQTLTIGDMQLEAGSTATPFERRPLAIETANVQRLYERFPAAVSYGFACPNTGGYAHAFQIYWKVRKRGTVTVTENGAGGTNLTSTSIASNNEDGFALQAVGTNASNTTFTLRPVGDARLAS